MQSHEFLIRGDSSQILFVVVARVESRSNRSVSEGHNIGRRAQEPVLMGPHLSSYSSASNSLVHNKRYLVFITNFSQFSEVVRGGNMVAIGGDWLDYDGSHILSGLSSSFDDVSDCLEASLFFFQVFFVVFAHWVFDFGERSNWPILLQTS